uniref:Down syndrome cell adhesion molecule-like protein Dscam2 n=1 Tax=Strigamia maritima TaxID=126957 RepID=T1JES3_STRMM
MPNKNGMKNLNLDQSGIYQCFAKSEDDMVHATAQVTSGKNKPKLIKKFEEKILHPGDSVNLECKASSNPVATITWYLDDQNCQHQTQLKSLKKSKIMNFLVLSLNKLTVENGGTYSCQASNNVGIDTYSARINVYGKLGMRQMSQKTVVAGDTFIITCPFYGYPVSNIEWQKDSRGLPIMLHQKVFPNGTLIVGNVKKGLDDGKYSCIVSNIQSERAVGTVEMVVMKLPKWVIQPNDTKIPIGSTALMPCLSTGFPKPTTTWYKAKGSDSRGETDVVKNENGYKLLANGSLEIHNVNLKHAGYYFCLSNNTIGSISAMALLSITVPPQIHKKLQNNTVRKGDSVYFKCVAHGDQPMKFIWYVNGLAVNQTTSNNGYLIKQSNDTASVTSEFAIKKTERKHSTSFICSAENSYGTENATFNLLVLETPDPPRDIKIIEANNRTVVIGWQTPFDGNMPVNKFILQYKLVADKWETGVRNLTLPGHKLQSAISSLKPSANYNVRVIAGNDIGMSLPSEEIEVLMPDQAPAGPPLNVNAIATDSNSLKVSWQAPHTQLRNGIIKGYNIGYKIASSSGAYQFRMLEVPEDYTATLSLPINDLHKFTQYSVVVQAFNDGGKGPLSKQVIAVTSESIPTKPPRDIKCSVLSSQSIHLTWQPPPQSSIHGMLQGFEINYKPVTDQKDATPQIQSLNGTSTKMTVRNLEKYTNYSVQISAMTRMGDGVKSEPVFCRTLEDIPSAPSDVKVFPVSAQSIIIAWKPPNRANGLITKYTVYEKQSGSTSKDIKKHEIRGNITNYQLTDLTPTETYQLWLTASTSVGESASSRVVSQSPNSKLRAAKIAGFGTTIVITQGEDVLLACKSVGMPPPQQKWMSDGNGVDLDTRHAILGDGSLLIKDTDEHDSDNYTCHVQNEHGQDYITYNLLIQSAPGVPFVEISLVTTSSIDVQWKVDRNGGSPIQGYKLYYKRDYGDWEIIDLDGAMNSYHLDGLDCGTKYQLYMVAYNKLGQGKATHVIAAETKGGIPISPSKSKLIEEGSTFITINLDSWLVDKCPIIYFVIEYKTRNSAQWRLLSNAITSEKHKLSLSDLSPATWYNLRIITHSNAGFAEAEYTFATLAVDGATAVFPSNAQFHHDFTTAPPMSDCYGGNSAYQIKGQATPQHKIDDTTFSVPPPPPPPPTQSIAETTFTLHPLTDAPEAAAKDAKDAKDTAGMNGKYDAPWDSLSLLHELLLLAASHGIRVPKAILNMALYSKTRVFILLFAIFSRGWADSFHTLEFENEPPFRVEFSNSTGTKIPCTTNAPMNISWILIDGTPVSNVNRLRHVANDGTLVFPPFEAKDYRQDVHAVTYKCMATRAAGTIISREVHVQGVMDQPFEPHVYDAFATKGSTAAIKCVVSGTVSKYVIVDTWIKDNQQEIKTSFFDDKKYTLTKSGDLLIFNVDSSDADNSYRCTAKHRLTGQVKTSATAGKLFVTESQGNVPAKILDSEKIVSAVVNGQAILSCVGQGHPPPAIKWFEKNEDGKLLPTVDERMKTTPLALIIRVVKETDSGVYVCLAENIAGSERKELTLNVKKPMEITLNAKNIKLESTEKQNLVCDIKATSDFTISWYRNGHLMPRNAGIRKLILDKSGIYQCFAQSEDEMVHAIAQVISGENQPKIIKKFEEKILNPGDNVHLECEATSNPIAKITWSLDDQNLSAADVTINERKENADTIVSELILKKVTVENGGVYRCAATNEAGSDSFGARVNIYGKLGMRSMLQRTVVAGDNFTMTCPYFGYPVSSIKWHKDSVKLPIMFHQTVHTNGSLSVSNVKKGLDDGKYSCIVSNIQGQTAVGTVDILVMSETCRIVRPQSDCISISYARTFSVAPKIMPFSFQEDLLREGMRARLQCVVSEGDSPITIQWLKDNAVIPPELYIKIQQLDEFSSILNIGHITPKHNGNYTCTAKNAATTAAYSAILNVNVPPKIIPFNFVDDQFYKGMRAHITCAVSQGDPPLNFRWLKDDRPIHASSEDVTTRQYDKYTSSLSIDSVTSVHTGNYTCVVSNRAVTVSHTAQLLVHVAPRIIPFSFQDKFVAEGRQARVMCGLIEGDAPVTFTWLKNGLPIKQRDIEISRVDDNYSILSIHSVTRSHTGNYTCVATNRATSSQYTATLIVNAAPKIIPFSFHDDHLFEGVLARVTCVIYQGDLPIIIEWLKDNQQLSTLEVPPKIVPFTFQDGHLLEGMLVRVSCVVSRGDLPLNISWLKDDKPISEEFAISVRVHNLDEYSSVLSIDPVTKKHDGNYTCIAKNMAGTDTFVASIVVNELPKWIVKPNDTKIPIGSPAEMTCLTTGFPKPTTTCSSTPNT